MKMHHSFGSFLSAVFYLEFWKREQAGIQYLWDMKNFEQEEVSKDFDFSATVL